MVAALMLGGCGGLPSGLGGLTNPFQRPEARVPGDRVDALPSLGTGEQTNAEPVSVPAPQAIAEWANPGGPATNSPSHVAVAGASSSYAVSVGSGSSRRSRLRAPPIVHRGYVVTMDARGVVTAIALNGGGRAWTIDTKPEGERGRGSSGRGLAASDGRVFIATAYNTLVAVNVANGIQLWSSRLSAPARSAPTVAGGRIYVVSATNVVHAFNAEDGAEVWTFTGIPETAGVLAASAPAVSGNRLIVPYSSGEIIGFDAAEGKPLWSDQLTGQSRFSAVSGIRDVAARPVIEGDTVYAVGVGGRLAAVSISDGNRLWGANVASSSTPAVAGNSVFVVTLENELVAVSRTDGTYRWRVKLPSDTTWVGPLLAGNALWVGAADGRVLRVSPTDGSTISEARLGRGVLIPPIAASGRVLILDDSARLNVF